MFLLMAHYVLLEGEIYYPRKVITYYFSPLCDSCYTFKESKEWGDDTVVVFQPVIMDDHDIPLQVFVLGLIKKFRLNKFWELATIFKTLEAQNLSLEEIIEKMGFSAEEIQWITKNTDYQKAIEREMRNPVKAYLNKNIVKYKTIKDSEITHVPMKISE